VFRTPGFEVNDVGFQQNADQRFIYAWFNYNARAGPCLPQLGVGFNPNSGWDFGGTRLWTQVNVWGNANFANFWSANFFANNRWHATSTGALRGGPSLHAPGGNNFNLTVNTDRRRAVYFSVQHQRQPREGDRHAALRLRRRHHGTTVAAAGPVAASECLLQRARVAVRRCPLTASGTRREYIVAQLDQTTVSLTTRLNYTFAPDLSLQLYAQPFLSAGDYTDYRRVVAPRARAFDERFHTFSADELSYDADSRRYTAAVPSDSVRFSNPDFNVRSLRSTAVLRWEYRPGSTLFVVWSHGRGERLEHGGFDLRRGVDGLMGLDGTNILMVKLNYWLNL
jgi:hypothetical protein